MKAHYPTISRRSLALGDLCPICRKGRRSLADGCLYCDECQHDFDNAKPRNRAQRRALAKAAKPNGR